MNKNILVIDDNSTICLMLKSWLVKNDFNAETASNAVEAKRMVKEYPFDLILSDIRMPEIDGLSFLNWVKKYDSDILVIMMTGYADIESVVEVMKLGATDYIPKPIDPDLLFQKIDEAFKLQENKSKNNRFSNDYIVPPGNEYKQILNQLNQIIEDNLHLLIIGERGSGKSSVVKYIYEKGIHFSNPLIKLDAYDFAKNNKYNSEDSESLIAEKFKAAKGGLFYISEIDELSKIQQSELLSMLIKQSRNENYVQVIISSEKNMDELKEHLIPKLFNLMENDVVIIPPLKGREEQILCFASYFLIYANSILSKNIEGIEPEMQKHFISYDWPENIQELKNTIIKAALLTESNMITVDIADELFGVGDSENETPEIHNIHSLRKENYEKEKICQALKLSKGNKTMAASILNIDRKTLYNKIKLYSVTI